MKKIIIGIVLLVLLIILLFRNNQDLEFIVHINASLDNYEKEGFGFVYKKENNKYFIVTNAHVIKDSNKITILNNKKEIKEAKLIGFDEYTDIAVLTIQGLNLSVAKTELDFKLNDKVYVLGSTISDYFKGKREGLVLEKGKKINISNSSFKAIGIKIPLEEGFSGSPLINKKNKVIGMVSLMDSSMSYAIPIKDVLNIASLLEQDNLKRPNLGAKFFNTSNTNLIKELDMDDANIEGIVVFDVIDNYPLNTSNIKEKSIITKIDNKRVYNIYDLMEELYKHKINDIIYIECFIDNEYKTYKVILDK